MMQHTAFLFRWLDKKQKKGLFETLIEKRFSVISMWSI